MAKKMIDQGHSILYFENNEGGHAGAADQIRQALKYTFLDKVLR